MRQQLLTARSSVSCTSHSMKSAPAATASWYPGAVCSGSRPLAPRCAITKGRGCSSTPNTGASGGAALLGGSAAELKPPRRGARCAGAGWAADASADASSTVHAAANAVAVTRAPADRRRRRIATLLWLCLPPVPWRHLWSVCVVAERRGAAAGARLAQTDALPATMLSREPARQRAALLLRARRCPGTRRRPARFQSANHMPVSLCALARTWAAAGERPAAGVRLKAPHCATPGHVLAPAMV